MPRSVLAIALLLLAGCEPATESVPPAASPAPAARGEVLLEVNGEAIHRHELDALAAELYGEQGAAGIDAAARQKLLDSMAASLALAQMAAGELPAAQRRDIETRTRRYRENLLISEYLRIRMNPKPVTEAMILDYYRANLERYGAASLRRYELVTTGRPLPGDRRRAFLERYAELASETSLARIDEGFRAAGFDTRYQSGLAEPGLLPDRVYRAIAAQPAGRLSDILFLDDIPYLLLVGEALQQDARPLAEVRDSIRQTLAAAQVREAVRTLSAEARRQATIRTLP